MRRIILSIFIISSIFSKKAYCQDYFIKEFQSNIKLEQLIKNDSLNNYVQSKVYSDIWIKSLDINEDDASGYYNRALEKIEKGLIEEALKDLDKSIAIDSSNSYSYGLRALCKQQINNNVKSALTDIYKALELDPNNWMVYNLRGYFYIIQNELGEAERLFDKAIEIKADNPESYYFLGIVYIGHKKFLKAKVSFDKAIRYNKDYYDAYFQKALCDYYNSNFYMALNTLDKLIEVNSNYVAAHLLKGDINLILNKKKVALLSFNKVLEIDPNNFVALIKKGLIALSYKDYNTCFDTFKKAFNSNLSVNDSTMSNKIIDKILTSVNISTNHFNVQNKISKQYIDKYKEGVCFYISGNYDDADLIFKELVSDGVNISELYELKGIIEYKYAKYNEAVKSLKKAMEFNSNNAFLYKNLGILYSLIGLNGQASINFLKALKLEPNNPYIYYLLGKLNLKIGEFSSAIVYYDKVLEFNPNLPDLYVERAQIKSKNGDYEGAVKDYKVAIDYYPYNDNLYYNCAQLMVNMHEYDSALKLISELADLKQYDYEPYFVIGNIYFAEKEYKQAIEFYKKAHRIYTYADFLNYYIALSFECLGEYDKATTFYRRVVAGYKVGTIPHKEYVFESYINLGFCYKAINNIERSERAFETAIEIPPYTPKIYNKKAKLLKDKNEFQYAILCLKKSLSFDSFQYGTLIELGFLYKSNKQIKEALSTFKRAIKLDTAKYIAYEYYGRIKYEMNEYNESIKYSKLACDKNPYALKSKVTIMISELAMGNVPEAKSLYLEIKNKLTVSDTKTIIDDLDKLIEKKPNEIKIIEFKNILLSDINS